MSSVNCSVRNCDNNAGTVFVLNNIDLTISSPRTNSISETYFSSFKCK